MAERNGKQLNAVVEGFDTNGLDESVLDTVRELTIQLVRNAVVHGIESPQQRIAHNKPAEGLLNLSLSEPVAGAMELSIEDDGNGIDYEAIRRKAATLPAFAHEDVSTWDRQKILMAMFTSGLSTMNGENEDAGRGVGMDVIRNRIHALGGKLQVATRAQQYTRFVIRFPSDPATAMANNSSRQS